MHSSTPPSPSLQQKFLALVALSSTGTFVGLFSKLSPQTSKQYKFSPVTAVICTEFFKLIISQIVIFRLLWNGELKGGGGDTTSRVPPQHTQKEHQGATNSSDQVEMKAQNGEADKDGATTSVIIPSASGHQTTDNNNRKEMIRRSGHQEDSVDEDASPAISLLSDSDHDSCRHQLRIMWNSYKVFWQDNITVPVVLHETGLAASYTIVNIVTYAIFLRASGSVFFLIKASSPVVTALLLFIMTSRRLNEGQWVAVVAQALGLFSTQFNPCDPAMTAIGIDGYLLILVNIVVSCGAGVWNEHIIKTYGTSVNAQNTVLYTAGVLMNVLLFVAMAAVSAGTTVTSAGDAMQGKSGIDSSNGFLVGLADSLLGGLRFQPLSSSLSSPSSKSSPFISIMGNFFYGYTPSVWGIIMANGSVGLVITAVYKYADVVIKTFGLAGSTVTLYLCEVIHLIPAGRRPMPPTTTLLGAVTVFYASYIYILPVASLLLTPSPPPPPSIPDTSSSNNDTNSENNVSTPPPTGIFAFLRQSPKLRLLLVFVGMVMCAMVATRLSCAARY